MARRKRQIGVATTLFALPMLLGPAPIAAADGPAVRHAVDHGDDGGRVEPVGGLLSEIFGGSSSSSGSGSASSSGGDRPQPNWDGIPYHDPQPMAIPSDASPIRDPSGQAAPRVVRGNQGRSIETSPSARVARRPSASPSPASPSARSRPADRRSTAAVPTPPSLQAPSAMAVQPPRQSESVNTWDRSPLSRETSSRRSTRRPVQAALAPGADRSDSGEFADESENRFGSFAAGPGLSAPGEPGDGSDSLVPRVSRREVATPVQQPSGSDSELSSRRTASSGSASGPGSASELAAPSSRRVNAAPSDPPRVASQPMPSSRRTAGEMGRPSDARRPSGASNAERSESGVSDPEPRLAEAPPVNERSGESLDSPKEIPAGRPAELAGRPAELASRPAELASRPAELASRPAGVPTAEVAKLGATPPSHTKEGSFSGQESMGRSDRPKPTLDRSAKVASSRDRVIALPASSRTPSVPESDREPAADANVSSELSGVRVSTEGPGELSLHESRDYTIRVENRGSIDVAGLRVQTSVPDGAVVERRDATRGNVGPVGEVPGGAEWMIEQLNAGETAEMVVRVRATQSGTFDLGVDWSAAPIRHAATIRVREPKLALSIEGPDEVVFGETRTYRVRVLNPGDGLAPNVAFTLGPDSSKPQSQPIGDIPAGKEAQFELELTAQDRGGLKIDGLVSGDLDLRAEASKTIRVIAANLEAVLSGPGNRYQDTEASYLLEVANRGNAESRGVAATLRIPDGVDYLGGIEGAEQRGDELRWEIDALPPGATREFEFRCLMKSTGVQPFAFACRGTAAGEAKVDLATKVTSVADLVMSVNDPPAPAPVRREVPYEITLRNRGSKAAEDVRVVVQFSNGIEPSSVTGHPGRVLTGQAVFEPIESIGAGEEIVLRVLASAEQAGNHRFRTEVRSGEILLVSEEATRFLDDGGQRISRRSGDAETR